MFWLISSELGLYCRNQYTLSETVYYYKSFDMLHLVVPTGTSVATDTRIVRIDPFLFSRQQQQQGFLG